jgi:hypothetical protein
LLRYIRFPHCTTKVYSKCTLFWQAADKNFWSKIPGKYVFDKLALPVVSSFIAFYLTVPSGKSQMSAYMSRAFKVLNSLKFYWKCILGRVYEQHWLITAARITEVLKFHL